MYLLDRSYQQRNGYQTILMHLVFYFFCLKYGISILKGKMKKREECWERETYKKWYKRKTKKYLFQVAFSRFCFWSFFFLFFSLPHHPSYLKHKKYKKEKPNVYQPNPNLHICVSFRIVSFILINENEPKKKTNTKRKKSSGGNDLVWCDAVFG